MLALIFMLSFRVLFFGDSIYVLPSIRCLYLAFFDVIVMSYVIYTI